MADLADASKPDVDSSVGGQGFRSRSFGDLRDDMRSLARIRSQQQALVIAMGAVVVIGFLARLLAALSLTPHVDEPSSLLAAHAVAERGLPILPSGTVYFQGATLSYLLQPFLWLGLGDLGDLTAMRLLLVVAGTITLYLCYRLGQLVSGDARVGIVMAALVAIDPLSVQWSGHLRMYGVLQALTAGLAWVYVLLLTRGPSRRRIVLVVLLYWAAVFTHVGAALLGPAMALAAAIIYRRSLFRQGALLVTLALCAMAPLTLMTLNTTLGTASVAPRDQERASSDVLTFVGDNLLTPLARFKVSPEEWGWTAPFHASNLYWLIPGLIVAVSTLYGGRRLLQNGREHRIDLMRNGAIMLLALYWLPLVGVGVFTVSPKERYLLNVHSLGYLFVAFLMVQLTSRLLGARRGKARLVAHGATLLVVLALGTSLVWRLENPVVHPNHNAAMAYTTERHQPGQPVIVALPPVAWLSLDSRNHDDLSFLAGSQDQSRAERYTRWDEDGELVDYWVGVNAIVSSDDLRVMLLEHPEAWVVVDDERMGAYWAYEGPIEQVLRDMTVPVYEEPGGAMVLRPAASATTAGADD